MNWSWVSPELPAREASVLRHILDTRAANSPDQPYVQFENGNSWTYAETLAFTRQAAAGLASLGVRKGDVVFALLPNGPDFLKTWFAVNFLGAALAAPNTALRGGVLQHMLTLSGARLAVIDASFLHRLDGLIMGEIQTVVVAGAVDASALGTPTLPGAKYVDFAACVAGADAALAPEVIVEPWEPQFILFTSGTTGPSKGAIVTYVQMHDMVMASFSGRLDSRDNYLLNMPLFHVSGTRAAMGMMMMGGRISLIGHFRTETFWQIVRKHGTTACVLLGAAATFLSNQPERPDDADNPMRLVAMVPMVKDPTAWSRRFGVDLTTSYGMSELSIPIISPINSTNTESCGRLRPGYDARIVDAHDQELPDGEVGELILRAGRPWTISPGYWRMPEATAEAWQNGWFHTGDNFRRSGDGDYYFVDRKKDAIRRRGENVSSYEIEAELLTHPAVDEVAAIAVPSPFGEDDIMVFVVRASGSTPEAEALLAYLRPRMAPFMLPRYFRFADSLPKTPSMRVRKDLLRSEGIPHDTWDREAAGIIIKRNS